MTPIASTGASTPSRIACSSSIASVLKSGATALLSIAALLLSATSAQAQNFTWDPTSGDGQITDGTGNWDTTTSNWTTDVGVTNEVGGTGSDAFNEDLIFGGGAAGTAGTITLTETGNSFGSLSFNSPNASSYDLDLNGNIVEVRRSSGTFKVRADATISDSSGGGELRHDNAQYRDYSTGSTLSISAVVADRGTALVRTYDTITLDLSGVNTYTGGTEMYNSSTLRISGAGQLGSGTYAGNITMNQGADFNYASSANQTLSGVISDDGTGTGSNDVTMSGSGTLTLTNANTYTGTTFIDGGTLVAEVDDVAATSGALGNGGNIDFGGGTLQYATGVTQDYSSRVVSSGSAISVDTNGEEVLWDTALANTNLGGLTKDGVGTLVIDAKGANTGVATVNGGTLEISATVTGNTPGYTSYQINNGSTLFFNETTASNIVLGEGGGDITFGSSVTGGTLELTGNTIFRKQTITTTGGARNFITGSGARFNMQGSHNITFDTAVGTDGDGIDLEVAANTSGGDVIKDGAGTVSLTNTSNSIGSTKTVTINAGTLEVGGAGRLQSGSYAGAITNAGIFKYNSTADQTLSGVISGTGALTQSGAATLTLSGANTYTGATTVSAGTLQLGGSLSSTSAISIASGATFSVNQVGTVTQGTEFSSTISGSGTLAVEGGGTVALTSVADTINISVAADSILDLPSGNINVGAINLGAGLVAGEWGAIGSGAANESDRITGSGRITNTAFAAYTWDGSTDTTWTATDTTSWSGGTFTDGDLVNFGDTGAGTVTVSGAVAPFLVNVDNTTGNDYIFTGDAISASSGFTKAGTGALTLQNTVNGEITLNGGTLEIGSSTTFSEGVVMAAGSTLTVSGTYTDSANSEVIALDNTGATVNLETGGIIDLTDLNTSGGTFVPFGNGTVNLNGGSFVSDEALTVDDTFEYTGTLNFNDGTFSVPIAQGFASGDPTWNINGSSSTIAIGILNCNDAGRDLTINFNLDATGVSTIAVANYIRLGLVDIVVDGTNYTGTTGTTINLITSNNSGAVDPLSVTVVADSFSASGLNPSVALDGNNLVLTLSETPTSFTWDGEADGNWSTAANWVGDAVPLTDTEVIFAGTAQASTTNDLTDYVANGIQFNNTVAGESFSLAGNAIDLTGDITSADAAGTIDDSIALDLQLTGGDRTISTGTDHNLAVSGVISEDGSARGLSKAGTGTLTLAGSNTYAGETAVTAGVLSITNAASLGTTAAGTTVAAVSQLAISGGITVAEPLSLNGNGNTLNSGALLSSGANTVSGQITINNGGVRINTVDGSAPLTVTGGVVDAGTAGSDSTFAGNFVFNSAIDVGDFNIRVAGSGTAGQGTATEFQLNTTGNVWGNATVFFDGSVKLGVSDAIAATSTMVFGWTAPEWSTSKLDLNGFDQTLASIATTDVTDDGSNMSITDSTGTGTLTLNQATNTTYTGRFTGGISLVKAGVGTLTLNNRSGTIPSGGDSDSSNTGSTTINAGTLEIQSGVDIGDTSVVTIDASASLNVDGTTNTETIGGLVGSGTVNIATGNTLNVANAAAASDTFAGVLAGVGGLTKAGASDSTLTLSGANTYTGATTVSVGTLQIGGAGKLGDGDYSGDITIASGATLQYSSSETGADAKLRGVVSGEGTLIKDGDDAELRLIASAPNTISNIEVNQGSLRGSGDAGALGATGTTINLGATSGTEAASLWYAGTFAGTTKAGITVRAGSTGTKTIRNINGTVTDNTAITLNDGLTITNIASVGTDFTLGGVISGSGGLTKEGVGTVVLSGVNTYTGATTVSVGVLSLSTAYLDDASTVSIAAGAALNLTHSDIDDVAMLNFAGVAQADGTYDSTNSGGLITGSGSIRVGGEQPTNDVASWAATFTASDASFTGSPATDPLTDYDNDGLSNLLEYVLGGSPIANQDTAVPTVSQDATHMIFTYNRSDISTATGNDVTIKAEYAADLSGSWTEAVNGTASVVIEEDTSADPDVVTVKVPLAGTEQFIRLNVVTGP